MIREYIIKISDEVMENEIADSPKELVRCKDCKHFTEPDENGFGVCMKIMHGCQSWGFCADGERQKVR
jgi:hypothetical protein